MNTDRKFDELCTKVKFCTRCVRMEESARVLSRSAGALDAKIMFIGEAPGRLGADAHEIPFHGDKAGHNFEELLAFAGLARSDIFVTNAVLCNPKAVTGNNATPNKSEIGNCSSYLSEQLGLLRPRIVVTLGSVALEAINAIEAHGLRLAQAVRTTHKWNHTTLIPIYHPGARAMIHRSMANQRSDYQFIAEQFRRLDMRRVPMVGITKRQVADIAREIIRLKGVVSYFALHKLLYLVECESWKRSGRRMTDAFFLRQKDGPYCTDLHLLKLKKALGGLVVSYEGTRPILQLVQRSLFDTEGVKLPSEVEQILISVIDAAGSLSDAELKTRVYLTSPMRRMLRLEKSKMINLYNSQIRFESDSDDGQRTAIA
jgi:uracil-DNA glycosylase family 4